MIACKVEEMIITTMIMRMIMTMNSKMKMIMNMMNVMAGVIQWLPEVVNGKEVTMTVGIPEVVLIHQAAEME